MSLSRASEHLRAYKAALIGFEGHLGALDSPVKGQLRAGGRLVRWQRVWRREVVAGSRVAPPGPRGVVLCG